MSDGPRDGGQREEKLRSMIDEVARRFERLQQQADRTAIGVRSALARELKGLSEKFDGLKGLAWDLRRRTSSDAQLKEFERQRRELLEAMKSLLRKIK